MSLKKLLLFLLFFVLSFDVIFVVSGSNGEPPNIVLVLADDMGFDDVSFRGQKEFLTPNIDALAYHGKILDRLYAPSLCTPSRGALMTGKYPIHTGTQHFVIRNEEPWSLPTNVTTIAQVFQRAGYSTNLLGKWHLGFGRREFTPTYRGFDYHYGYWGAFIDYFQRRGLPSENSGPNSTLGYDFRRNMNLECGELGTYVTDLLTNEAERIIANNSGSKPLFLLLNHLATHTANADEPLQAPDEEVSKFGHIRDPNRRIYAAMVSKLDSSLGRVVAALERADMLQNSILVFYSDNGAPSRGLFANTGSNWPLRGQKNTPWEGGVRVTGAIWSPLLQGRASVWRQPMYVGDWLPTLAAAAGIHLDSRLGIDGINLWPQLSAPKNVPRVLREIVHNLDDEWYVVSYMLGPWKYINGSTLNGQYDAVLTNRGKYDVDPRDSRYGDVIRNSMTSRILRKYDGSHAAMDRVKQLRRQATIKCGGSRIQHDCNAMVEECLYHLDLDPCEQNNLANQIGFQDLLVSMRTQVEYFRNSAWPHANVPGRPEYQASRHKCTWTTFLQELATEENSDCDYYGQPCGAS